MTAAFEIAAKNPKWSAAAATEHCAASGSRLSSGIAKGEGAPRNPGDDNG
jgi:hypothetical protein